MYTRCPSCGAEISFEPPANRESLPEDYKHRIRCPICGVTIGVKINKPIYATTTFPSYGTQPVATSFEPVLAPQAPTQQRPVSQQQKQSSYAPAKQSKAKSKSKAVTAKKSGVGRNIMMMLFSLVFVAIAVVGYLINNGTIKELPAAFSWVNAASIVDGIAPIELMIKDMAAIKAAFELGIGFGIMTIVPAALFVFAGINFIVAFISAIGKKYGRAYNLLMSLIIAGLAVATLFRVYVIAEGTDLLEYFVSLITEKYYLVIAVAAWGLIQLLFSLFFLKSLKRKKRRI